MGKASKSQKKFQKNHLKRTVDQRKAERTYKQKFLSKQKKGKQPEYLNNEELSKNEHNENEVFENGAVESFFNSNPDNLPIHKPKKSKSKSAGAEPKNALENLSEADPELLNYLKGDGEISDIDEKPKKADEQNGAVGEEDEEEDYEEEDLSEISVTTIRNWKKSLETQQSAKNIRKVCTTFKNALKTSNVMDNEAYKALLDLSLKTLPDALQHSIPISSAKNGTKYVSVDNKKFKAITSPLKSYATGLSLLLARNQDTEMALKTTKTLIPYFISFKKQIKALLEAVGQLGTSENVEISAKAFEFLKTTGEEQPSLLDTVLQTSYNGLLKNSLQTDSHTLPALTRQKDMTSILFEINPKQSFELGFQYIRQLALHLRSSIVNKSPEAYKTIYNWQFVHSLDYWMKAVGAQCDKTVEAMEGRPSPLRDLIYPLVQVVLGTVRLIPSPQYFPLRFFLLRGLISLALKSDVYIPLLPLLTEVLGSSTITKSPRIDDDLAPFDFQSSIRASKAYLGTRVYQNGVCDEFTELVGEFFFQHSKSIAFPELAVPVILTLKRFIQRSNNGRFKAQLQRLVERLEENTKFVQQKRNNINLSPTNKAEVSVFLKDLPLTKTPLGSYLAIQRQVKADKAKQQILKAENESRTEETSDEEMSDA